MNKKHWTVMQYAQEIARHYPIFPTYNKKPALSNKELRVERGYGGYKTASQDKEYVQWMFDLAYKKYGDKVEIAVPMGEMSGLMCIDADSYKELSREAKQIMIDLDQMKTLTHQTRSEGLHFFFKHPGNEYKFPAQLCPGIDIKAAGNGYVCFPPTPGYKQISKTHSIKPFPKKWFQEHMQSRGGTGNLTTDSFNELSDDELIKRIVNADALYPALRTLSWRLAQRTHQGKRMSQGSLVGTLEKIMQDSPS